MENPELTTAIIACITGLGGFITAITAYIRSNTETEAIRTARDDTKVIRDKDSLQMHDAIEKLKFHVDANKNSITLLFTKSDDMSQAVNALTTQFAVMDSKLDQLLNSVDELKKDRRRT